MTELRESRDRQPVEHELKCWPPYFEEVLAGRKPFEVRKNDRDYRVGDTLWLREWTPPTDPTWQEGSYTGRDCRRTVSYVTDFDQRQGHVVIGLARPEAPPTLAEAKANYHGGPNRIAAALHELVDCKKLKDALDAATVDDHLDDERAEYKRRKPLAWKEAEAALDEFFMESARSMAAPALPKEGPRRACVLTALLEADTREDMLRALDSLGQALSRNELTKGTWGSPGHGAVYEYTEGTSPTHDEYFEQTRAYLEKLRLSEMDRIG